MAASEYELPVGGGGSIQRRLGRATGKDSRLGCCGEW